VGINLLTDAMFGYTWGLTYLEKWWPLIKPSAAKCPFKLKPYGKAVVLNIEVIRHRIGYRAIEVDESCVTGS